MAKGARGPARRGGGLASVVACRELLAVDRPLRAGRVQVGDLMAVARRWPPQVLEDVLVARRIPRRGSRAKNLEALERSLAAMAEEGHRARLKVLCDRFERAILGLRGSRPLPLDRWVEQWVDVEDRLLGDLARITAAQIRHPARTEPLALDRVAALEVLAAAAARVIERPVEEARPSPQGEQLLFDFASEHPPRRGRRRRSR